MVELLRKIYHRFYDFKIIQFACRLYMNGFPIGNYFAYNRLKKIQKKKAKKENKNRKIRVVFLCQAVSIWNKVQSVFEQMMKDDRFEPIILAIPETICKSDTDTYKYFYKLYGDYVINCSSDGEYFDLEAMNPDYVFFQRPYDQYLPRQYRSDVVSRYAKICHVVYAYNLSKETEQSVLNKRFFRNVYMYFAENSMYYDFNINRFKKSHRSGVRKTLNIGYPAFEEFVKKRTQKRSEEFNVLWTPRWTEDEKNGGSNFLRFKDKVLELPDENASISLTFRPHPMTFSHFISVGSITQSEVEKYVAQYDGNRKFYDGDMSYEESFWNSDVLLTDVSSIIIEYFLTGKPIVYCDTGAIPNKLLEKMLEVFYVVKTWEEAKATVLRIKEGNDPLKEEREKKIKELLGEDFEHISEGFLEIIYRDYAC